MIASGLPVIGSSVQGIRDYINKEKAISDAKEKANMYLIILEIGLTVVYLAVLPLEKKELLKFFCFFI